MTAQRRKRSGPREDYERRYTLTFAIKRNNGGSGPELENWQFFDELPKSAKRELLQKAIELERKSRGWRPINVVPSVPDNGVQDHGIAEEGFTL